ncbi:MAG: zinc-binding alcohol dehydrogenase family protein [Bacteroidetes bacterium]|nr:zinc-binding alcohol dehydrogenase family protein [Bacteroidota bacterium]MBS1972795.1 zinc-binding alcohol dehydrogenase family protein [Bacteroidota bacterium]
MKSMVCIKPGSMEYKEHEMPEWKKGLTLLRITRIGICGTDLHAFDGSQPYFNYPRILGHELAAEIVKTDAEGFAEKEPVTFLPYFYCDQCTACKKGKTNCCASLKVCGVHIDGGMSEYFLVPSGYLLHGGSLAADELALVEPFSIGAHAVRRAEIARNEFALVMGAGPIGLATAEMARVAGAQVIMADVNERRLKFCREKLKMDHLANATAVDVEEYVRDVTQGAMPDVIFDATGNLSAINNAFRYMAHAGKYVLVGLQKKEIGFSHPEFHKREATLMSSRNATRQDFMHVMDCMEKKLINPGDYITNRMKFNEVKDKFENLLDPGNGAIKAVVEMD